MLKHIKDRLKRQEGESAAEALVVLSLILVVIGLVGYGVYYFGSTESNATNEKCVVYSGGSFEDKAYTGTMEPGSTKASIGWGSKKYCYKNDQRSYIGGSGDSADAKPVEVVGGSSGESNSNVRLIVDYQLYFKLNMDTNDDAKGDAKGGKLRKFHENIGVKTKAYTEDGWRTMLQTYFEPQIERSMESAALEFDWDKLYSDEATRKEYQAEVIRRLKVAIKDIVGDDYFCGPNYVEGKDCGDFTFTVGKPELVSTELIAAIESEETAKRQTQAQTEKNATAERKLLVDQKLVDLYGAQGALIAKAIDSGKVKAFYITPEGTIVPAPAP